MEGFRKRAPMPAAVFAYRAKMALTAQMAADLEHLLVPPSHAR